MTQWHPIFAQLLRPAVEAYYEVQTTLPVGDAPREADFVLLRRTAPTPPPFTGLWRHLTTWNILEFKGPTVSPRHGDVEMLVELGLGIDRRLQDDHTKQGKKRVAPEEVSFWYLANHLGPRFLAAAEQKLGSLEPLGPGLWRCRLLQRLVFLVSSVDLPVEADGLPLHIVGVEPLAVERQSSPACGRPARPAAPLRGLARHFARRRLEGDSTMARTAGKRLHFDIRPAVESLGLEEVLEQVGIDRVVEQVGIDRVIRQVGAKELIRRIDLDELLAGLSPAKRRALKKRLQ